MTYPKLDDAMVLGISKALADGDFGLTGLELGRLIPLCGLRDVDPTNTKYKRLYNSFAEECKNVQNTDCVYKFILEAFKPARGLENPEQFECRRIKTNQALMLVGICVEKTGELSAIKKANTIDEVHERTRSLLQQLHKQHTHEYVLRCCRDELLGEDYFHAVHEAAKSLEDRVKTLSCLELSGTNLFDTTFSIKNPVLALNSLRTETEKNQQNGFREMLNGTYHMYRNVTAHELKIKWMINESDAIDALKIISILHYQLDQCISIPKSE